METGNIMKKLNSFGIIFVVITLKSGNENIKLEINQSGPVCFVSKFLFLFPVFRNN